MDTLCGRVGVGHRLAFHTGGIQLGHRLALEIVAVDVDGCQVGKGLAVPCSGGVGPTEVYGVAAVGIGDCLEVSHTCGSLAVGSGSEGHVQTNQHLVNTYAAEVLGLIGIRVDTDHALFAFSVHGTPD